MTDQPAATRRVVRTEHRDTLLRAGIVCAVLGLGAVIGGAITFSVLQATQVLSSIADADVGDTVTFQAEGDDGYALVLMRGEISDEGTVERLVRDTTCTIVGSDGNTRTVEGSRQFSSSQTDFGASIGTFTVPPGATEVTCVGEGSRLVFDRYAVAPERKTAQIVSYVIIGLGVVVGLVGVSMITRAWNGRSVVERVPV